MSADEVCSCRAKDQAAPCRLIPLTNKGETIDYFYRCGTQLELEEALASWLRKQISLIEEPREGPRDTKRSGAVWKGLDRIRQNQWLAFAGNLYSMANRHRENHNYVMAHALYGRALVAARKVEALEGADALLLHESGKDEQAVSEILRGGERACRSSVRRVQMVAR